MNLTRVAVRRFVGTGVISAAVLVVGLFAARFLPVDLLPEVDMPRISIITLYPGVGPEEIETLLTRPVEQAVASVQGIDRIESVSGEGISRVQLQFAWGTDLDGAVNDVRAYLDRLGARWPEDAERPVVYKLDLSSVPVAFIGLSGGGDPRRLRYLADDLLSRRLERISGVAAVSARGGREREIRVALDAERLVALGVTAQQVAQALARDNRNVSAGDVRETGREVLVRAVGEWDSPREVEDALVASRGGRPIYVRDLASVRDTFVDQDAEQWVDGQLGIVLNVSKQSGANTIDVVERVRDEIGRINEEFAGRLRLTIVWDSSDFIRAAVTNVQTGALYGAALAVLVLLVFLRDLRATAIIATAIPLSVVATFALMYFAGFSLNIVSFGGLALGIGMLVDNAIVILENVHRKRDEGLAPMLAAVEGAREVGPAVVAGTLTTLAVFAPIVFLGGFAGVFFGELAAVVAFSLACSLLVSLTLVPSLSARFLRPPGARRRSLARWLADAVGRGLAALEGGYARVVGAALRAPWFTVACAVLLLVASLRLLPTVGFELMPETDEGQIDMDVELAVGTPIERTAPVMMEIERRVRAALRPGELATTLTSAGPRNWWRPEGANTGTLRIGLVPVSQRSRGIDAILADARQAVRGLPGVEVRARKGTSNLLMRFMRGGTDERLVVEVRGHDLGRSAALAERVRRTMAAVAGVTGARVEREEGLEERAVRVDAAGVADLGLSRADVADTVETYVLGHVATRLREGGDEYDVRVQLREADRRDASQLATLPILTPAGTALPLSAVAEIGGRRGPTSIAREGQERLVRVLGDFADRPLSAVVADLRAALDGIDRPEGFTVALGGEQVEQEETFGGLLSGIALAVLLVFSVMAVQFDSLRHPLVIMGAVPFAFIGVVATLVLTGTTLNMNSFLGVIVLVGVVVNNAILLVDYTNLLRREQRLALVPALRLAARRRLRPVLMTTLTTVLALVPIALGVGEGSEIQAPMARVIVGGLISATLVTLVVTPCVYYLTERRGAAREAAAAAAAAPAESPQRAPQGA